MFRSRHAGRKISALLGLMSLVALGAATPVAASTTVQVHMELGGPYACIGPCATATFFSVTGQGTGTLGRFRYKGEGTVLGYNAATNCLNQQDSWTLTARNHHSPKDRLYLSIVPDTFCFTNNPNVSIETGSFTITGGSGKFSDASGSGTFTFAVYTHPQRGDGVLDMSLTY